MAPTARRCLPPSLLSVATGQHDLLRLSQLRAEGLRSSVVRRLVGEGVLHDVHRGVFKVGTPALSPDGRRLAAVFAAGSVSALSHRDAAEIRRLALRGRRDTVDVMATRGCRDQPGITLHRVRRLHSADVSTVRGIPVTSVARTFVDLADVLSTAELRRVIHEAEVEGLFDLAAVDDAIRRANGRDLRTIAAAIDGHRPRSKRDIEQQLAQIAWRAGLRGARRNMRTLADSEEFELDGYYPDLLLCLEADGYGVHKTRKKFNSDRRRDRILKLKLGITTLRYTWEDVTARERESEAELATYAGRQCELRGQGVVRDNARQGSRR